MDTAATEMFDDSEPANKNMVECHSPSFNGNADQLNLALEVASGQLGMSVHAEIPLLISDDVCGWPALTRYTFSDSDPSIVNAETVFGSRVKEPQRTKNTILVILLMVTTFALHESFVGVLIVVGIIYCFLPIWHRGRTNKSRQKNLLNAAAHVGPR